MAKLSEEAASMLHYFYKHKDDVFTDFFNASFLCARKALGHISVDTVKPVLLELAKQKYITPCKISFRSPRYKLNLKKIEKFIEESKEDVYTQEYRNAVEDEIKKYKKFVVTTAVQEKEVNKAFLRSIKNYAERNNALMLVLPCEDVASRGKEASKNIKLSPDLADFRVIFKDTYLNKNLCLGGINVSAKQINALTGLDRMVKEREASLIVASPKVFLKYIPNMHDEIPPALMTTGAITLNNYDTDRYMSKRTSTLAENDHDYGVVLIEIENDNIFHFRQVQASKEGTLTDMGIEYLPDGSIEKLEGTVMVMGDSHVGYHDRELHEKVMELAEETNVDTIVLHDVFHGSSISHHDAKKSITRAIRAQEGRLGLEVECRAVKNYIEAIEERGFKVVIPQANHNNHLLRYLEEGRYVEDPVNLRFAASLIAPAIDKINPLQYAIESLLGFKKDTVKWLDKDKSYKVYGVELSVHGDRGANGAKGSLAAFEKGLGNCVVAHSHSAAILRKVFCVGTVGEMDMGYNEGMSNWTRTCCLIYSNGTKQLVNFIPNSNGDYTYTA